VIDTNSYTFWIIGVIWFTVPILSWLWSLASLFFYRKALTIMADATKVLDQIKTMNEQMLNFRLESMEIRTKAEEELKLVCAYYAKVSDLITKDNV